MIKIINTNNNNVTLTVFTSEESSFLVTATLVQKDGHAFLINAGFTQSGAKEIVDYLKQNDLDLDKIFIIHGDPDYYFGLETIKAAYPQAIAYATQPTTEHIVTSVLGKLQVWKSALGDNAPKNVVIPQIIADATIEFQGLSFELVGLDSHRTSLYSKDLSLLLGGIDTFNEIHVFLADTSTKEAMESWIASLKNLQKLNADIIIPSHGAADKSFDGQLLLSTIQYLETAIKALTESKNSEDFVSQLDTAFPGYANKGVLELSAKVVMKEIPWG